MAFFYDAAFWHREPAPAALHISFCAPVSLSCGGGGVGEAAVAVSEEVVWGKQDRRT